MSKTKNNFFVVWVGENPGIYTNWKDCQEQINGYPDAKYKGFKTLATAEKAFEEGYEEYWGKDVFESTLTEEQIALLGKPKIPSISVDAACSTTTGLMEYRGVDTETKKEIFHGGPYEEGTNNVGEFLAIVHALAFCKKNNLDLPIYSDSKYAISWVKNKHHRSNLIPSEKNKKLFELLERGEKWLAQNTYSHKILKWETQAWGENPADFGRK